MRIYNEIFRKAVSYDNVKSHNKPGLHLLFRRYNFEKKKQWGGQIDPPPTPQPFSVKCPIELAYRFNM